MPDSSNHGAIHLRLTKHGADTKLDRACWPLPEENVPWATLCDLPNRRSPRTLPGFYSNGTSLRSAAGGSICVVGAPARGCISTGRFDGTARGFLPSEHGVDHSSCAAHSRLYAECFYGTVSRTGATLHAGIAVSNFNLSVGQAQDRVGADQKTSAAADAFLSIKSERDDIL